MSDFECISCGEPLSVEFGRCGYCLEFECPDCGELECEGECMDDDEFDDWY